MDNAVSSLPQPRRYTTIALLVAAFSVLPFTVMWCWSQDDGFLQVLPQGAGFGLLFAGCFGSIMGLFLQGDSATVAVADRGRFVRRLNDATAYCGYYPAKKKSDFLAYRPAYQTGVAAGWISVQLQDGQAVIVGPKIHVRRVVRKLERI